MKFTILMALVAGVVAEGETSHHKVSVYVLNNAEVPSEVRYAAQGLATQMFARIGVNVEWSLRRPTPQSSDRGIVVELTAKTPQTFPPATLAYAKPYEGVHVSIFYDRMKRGGNRSVIQFLLAHVLVHEIAHILQGACWHSETGIMKALWDGNDLAQMRRKPLDFTKEDITLIYMGLDRDTTKPVSESPADR